MLTTEIITISSPTLESTLSIPVVLSWDPFTSISAEPSSFCGAFVGFDVGSSAPCAISDEEGDLVGDDDGVEVLGISVVDPIDGNEVVGDVLVGDTVVGSRVGSKLGTNVGFVVGSQLCKLPCDVVVGSRVGTKLGTDVGIAVGS